MKRFRGVRGCAPIVLAAALGVCAALDVEIPVHYDSLDNGLKFIVVPDTQVAVVSCRLYYFVGSMYEGPGTSGLSHMYEHMMFKGTKTLGTKNYSKERPYLRRLDSLGRRMNRLRKEHAAESVIDSLREKIYALLQEQRRFIKKDEIWELYQRNGGTRLNAWTGDDMTAYIVTLPRNKVELFFWIESDRMRNPVLREFYSEREVVTRERRMRYDNRPENAYWERLFALFYIAHPYRLPTIGWMSDIESYTREKLEAHIKKFYRPDNALVVLVGNIDSTAARKDLKRYFGRIPRGERPVREVVTREPEILGRRELVIRRKATPRIDMLFQIPGFPHQDLYRLDVIEGILSGRSGRLYRRLVTEEQLCTDAGAGNAFRLHNGYFHVYAELKAGTSPDSVESILTEEIRRLHTSPPTEREMRRNINSIRKSFVSGLKSLEGLSDRLAWFERLNSWRDLLRYPESIAEVRRGEIPAIARKYLTVERMTIGMLLAPDGKKGEEQ